MKKVITIFIIVYVSLVGFNFSLGSASATIGQDIVGQHIVVEDYKTFLPIITNNYPPIISPFWIEIAALHQIPASDMKTMQYMSDAEYKAFIAAAFPTLIEALVESGAGGTRIYLKWWEIENEPLQYDWTWYDNRLSQIGEKGFEIIVNVEEVPYWAANPADPPCPPIINPDSLDDFARFLTDLVNRYKVPPYNVKYWELFNEPDNTGTQSWPGCWGDYGEDYANMLSVAYPAIKAADPEAVVLQGGIAYDEFTGDSYPPGATLPFGPFYRYHPDDVMEAGGGSFFDVLNFHYFPGYAPEWERWDPNSPDRKFGWIPAPTCGDLFDDGGGVGFEGLEYDAGGIDLIAKASHYRNRMHTCYELDHPVWLTEIGEIGDPNIPGSLAQQAQYVIKGNVRGLAVGIEQIVWYALTTPNDIFEQQLLFDDFSPKPAFYAYKTMTSELKGYDYDRTLDISNVEGYVFVDNSGSEKVVAWGSGSLTFTPASQLRVVDRDGNVTIIQDGDSGDGDGEENGSIRIQLPINDEPVFIQKN